MKGIITTAIIIFFSILQLQAQSDLRNGYIITNNNDTIYGMIDYSWNRTNDKKCTFKKESNSETQVFIPNDIKSFRFIESKYYDSKNIEIDGVTNSVFLELLISGKVNLYYHKGLGKYYLEKNEQLYELKNSTEVVSKNGYMYETEKREFVGVMTYLLQDANIQNYIDKAVLDHKSLIKIAKEYNKQMCSDEECIIYEKKVAKVKKTYGVVVGLNGLSVVQSGTFSDEMYYLNNSQFEFRIYPSVGMYYKANMSGENERLYLQFEGTYSYIDLKTSNSYSEPLYSMTFLNDINWTQNTFNGLILLKYESPTGKIRPTFQVGGFAKYSFITNYTRNLVVVNSIGNIIETTQTSDSPFSKIDYGINCGLGFTSQYRHDKELFFDMRYQRGFGLFQNFNTNTFLFNIGFQIGK
nr:hypothetical protein [uncultured Carboxylicivirga sp.]